jgi:hypothetical protein
VGNDISTRQVEAKATVVAVKLAEPPESEIVTALATKPHSKCDAATAPASLAANVVGTRSKSA